MAIIITYKDSLGKYVDLFGNTRDFQGGDVKIHDGEVLPNFVPPLAISDVWDGVTIRVQETIWEGYKVSFQINSSELNDVKLLQTVDEITIKDTVLGYNHIVDTRSFENFLFNEPEKIEGVNSWMITFIYRVGRTIVNKGTSTANKNNINCKFTNGGVVEDLTFYTDFDVLPRTTSLDEEGKISEDGVNTSTYVITQEFKDALFFLSKDDANSFKAIFDKAQEITINGEVVLGNSTLLYEAFAEDLIKITANCLISSIPYYPLQG